MRATGSQAIDFAEGSFSLTIKRYMVGIFNFSLHDKHIFVVKGTPSDVRKYATYAHSLLRLSWRALFPSHGEASPKPSRR